MLTDDVGVAQHALETVPNRKFGYCTDDVARAFMVAIAHARLLPSERLSRRFASTYLAFLEHAQMDDGRFHNFMAYDRTWSDDVGTQDSCGRAIWALGYGVANAPDDAWRRVCGRLLDQACSSLGSLEFIRSRAYAALGLAYAHAAVPTTQYATALIYLADQIFGAYDATAQDDWCWFENRMTYDNARLPEALLRAGRVLDDARYSHAGLRTLKFYEGVTIEGGVHVPIGNDGWYQRGGARARYAQQPLEAFALVDAELAAFDISGDAIHFENAELGLEWYYGKNSRGIVMAQGGGCYDGLAEDVINYNQGAESTLAFLGAAYTLALRRPQVLRAVR